MAKEERVKVSFRLNGKEVKAKISSGRTLLELLRRDFSLNAVKEGCGKGECGACTVLLNNQPVNSCLKLAATLKPADEVITLEYLNEDPLMQTLQKAYVEEGAVQCGFCIPGMVVSSYSVIKKHKNPTESEIKEGISGNLCRCTGYSKIVQAIKKAVKAEETSEIRESKGGGGK